MAFTETSLAKAAFKKLFGKAHTSNDKDLGNESVPSSLPINLGDVFGELIPQTAAQAILDGIALDCTGSNKLSLTLDNTSNNKAYYVTIPSGTHPLKSLTNPSTGTFYATGDRVTRIIPSSFGTDYRPIMRRGDGTEIPPFASEDWFVDTFAGVVTSEDPLSLGSTGTLECYIYVGKMLDEIVTDINQNINAVSLQDAFQNGQQLSLDGYNTFSVSGTNEAYGVNFDVGGDIDLATANDVNITADKTINLTSTQAFSLTSSDTLDLNATQALTLSTSAELTFSDGNLANTLFTDSTEQYGTELLTTRKSIIGAINEAFLAGGAAFGSERAVYRINARIESATGLEVSSFDSGSIEVASPEGYLFNFSKDIFVYFNGQLLANDSLSWEANGNVVVNDVALNNAADRFYFGFNLENGDVVQVININNQV